jgi:hypothetical protein
MAVRGEVFQASIPIGIRIVANPVDPRFLILHLSTAERTVALERPIFKRKKGFLTLSLGLICYSIASSQPLSRDTAL